MVTNVLEFPLVGGLGHAKGLDFPCLDMNGLASF